MLNASGGQRSACIAAINQSKPEQVALDDLRDGLHGLTQPGREDVDSDGAVRLAEDPQVALLIGTESERIDLLDAECSLRMGKADRRLAYGSGGSSGQAA